MFLDVPLIADIAALSQQRQLKVDESLRQANLNRRSYDYDVNEQVLLKVPDPDKGQDRFTGPCRITRVHCNGTVTIQTAPNVTDRVNIRRIKPCRS